jgi:hypothetical protein
MLRNPKYTGYNVWNRHDKRKGRPLIRPRAEWVWSPTPTHDAIVPREIFDMVEDRATRNTNRARQRASHSYAQRAGQRAGRLYPLRGRVRHLRTPHGGQPPKGKNWYRCRFVYPRGAIAADAAGHPRTIGIKEEKILPDLLDFMGDVCSAPTACSSYAPSSRNPQPPTGKSTTTRRRSSSARRSNSSARSTGKLSGSRSTMTPTIPSSRQHHDVSKS